MRLIISCKIRKVNGFNNKLFRSKKRPCSKEQGRFKLFIYNCIVNETAALEWFGGNFLQLYLKYKKMYSGIVAQNLQLYRKYEILVCKGIYNYIVNKEKFTVQIVFV